MVKKCLIVSYYFPPTGGAGVQRIVKLIKYASRKNWRFTVISAEEHSHFQPQDSSLLDELPPDLNIIRAAAALPAQKFSILNKTNLFKKSAYWKRWLGAFVQIPDSRKSWNSAVKKTIYRELAKNDYDCLLITAPPYSLTLLAVELQNELSIPVILDMRDPWSSHPYKLHPTFMHRRMNKRLEYRTLSAINNGIHVTKRQLDDYRLNMKNFDISNWSVITNGYDEADFAGLKEAGNVEKKRFNIAFLGTIHADINSPEYLFRAMKYLKKSNKNSGQEIHFHHIGNSVPDLKSLTKKYNIEEQITLWNYRSHKESLQILMAMDAFYQIHHPAYKGSEYIIGSKMYEYLRLKKPILAVVPNESEVADIINNCNCGEVVNSVQAADIAAALLKIIKGGNSYGFKNVTQYERGFLADKFISVFTEAINKSIK